MLVERLSNRVAREGVEPQAPRGLALGPVEQLAAYAQPMKAYADVELGNRFDRRCNKADQLPRGERKPNTVLGKDLGFEVGSLLGKWMRVGDSDAELKALAPHANKLLLPRRRVLGERGRMFRHAA